jgi:hypothetical protein
MQPRHVRPRMPGAASHRAWVAAILLSLAGLLAGTPSEAAHFRCAAADVACLKTAISQANANGQDNTIVLAAGVYTLDAVDNDTEGANGLPSVTGTLTIRGAGADLTTITRLTPVVPPGQPTPPRFRLLHVGPGGALTLEGLTLTKGAKPSQADWDMGAGILALGSVTIRDSVVSNNGFDASNGDIGTVTFGGGVAGGAVVISHSTITDNYAHAGGGGIYIFAGGTLTITESVISKNSNYYGGGGIRFDSSGALTISDTLVLDNATAIAHSPSAGGLVIGGPGGNTTTITRTTIAGNSGVEAGGIYYFSPDGHLTISRSAIVANQGAYRGGGIAFTSGTLTVTESTIANNSTGLISIGGVAGIAGLSPGSGTVTNSSIVGNTVPERNSSAVAGIAGALRLQNSIVAGNTATAATGSRSSDCGASIVSLGNNLFGDPTGCGAVVSDRLGEPGLGALLDPGRAGGAHFPLLPGSQAIDAGDNAVCGAIDQQGLTRPIDGNGDGVRTCDIGAVEFYPVVNDLVVLDSMRSTYVPPSARERLNPLTAGGTFEITAVFTSAGAQDICHVGFQVIALRGEDGGSPTLVTRRGALLGGEGIVVPARVADAKENLRADHHEQYRFTIGLTRKEPITFLVNVVGEAAAGCRQ